MTSPSLNSRMGGFSTTTTRTSVLDRGRRILHFRRILRLLIVRDLKVRYTGNTLGWVWTVLDPLLMSLVYFYVFTKIFNRNVGYDPYMLFLLTGQLPWFWFNNTVSSTARALRSEAQMVRSTNVPRELWVLRTVASKSVEYLFSLPVIAAFALIYLAAPHVQILLMPVAFAMEFLLLTGIGLLLAPLVVLIPDVDRLIRVVMRVMFYASPILYSVHNVKAGLGTVLKFNPFAGILTLYRAAFFPQEVEWTFVLHSLVGTALLLALGIFVFGRLERQVLKEI